ncbi:ribonuclease P protein component [Buchnera aphidicola]|uniref:Ribonuclease P protein component n=1 Tax=Buchnera aphidicola subsp. Melaphis rhois TaxID=118103 RepID=A0A4D6Y233_BUCMH|nr:ribonuclease P protein component [Buchnera aphidicola]QCI23067.1 ribonuclease P protein component [Buchnera aphidicola (Melaphis rhois)]
MKLLTSLQFKYVFNQSKKIKCKELTILYRTNTLKFSRLGISISRKNIKYSYKRNQIKRIIRESFRLIQYKLINADFIVVVSTLSINIDRQLLSKKLEYLWSHHYQ